MIKNLKISPTAICIFLLLTIFYFPIHNHIVYNFIESNNTQQIFPGYYNYSKAYGMLINNTNISTDQLPLSLKHLVSVGEIPGDNNNKLYSISNQTIYSNNINLISQNASKYYFSANKSEIHSPENNSHTLEFDKAKIALVKPTFTDAAYKQNEFYAFYRMYDNVSPNTNITSNLNLLTSELSPHQEGSIFNVFAMLNLIKNLKWITNNSNITILSDQDVDSKSIFNKNGSNLYDVIILGHQEYVTQNEYDNLKNFVSNGGTMILLDGNALYVQVKYDRNTNQITLVKGHGWAFNGKSAWKSVDERWKNETAQWVGSNYLCAICKISYLNNPFKYIHHEENYITNPNDIILLNYPFIDPLNNFTKNLVVATYELNYNKGKVISLGLYSDDIITNGSFDRFFDSLLVKYVLA